MTITLYTFEDRDGAEHTFKTMDRTVAESHGQAHNLRVVANEYEWNDSEIHADHTLGAWVIGHNVAGYLPEADTHAFAQWSDAWDALQAEMREYADTDDGSVPMPDEPLNEYEVPAMRATVDSILRDDAADEESDWSCEVADADDRRIAFWIQWEDTRQPDEND